MSKLDIAVAGAGHIGLAHMGVLRNSPTCRLSGVVDPASAAALLEKPIAPTVAEATQLIEIAEEANARILIGHHRAHSPIMEKARQIVEQRVLGRLVAVMGSAMFYKPDEYFDVIRGEAEPLVSARDGLANLRVTEAIAEAAKTGKMVEITT